MNMNIIERIEDMLLDSGMDRMSKYFGKNHKAKDGRLYFHILWNRDDQYYIVTSEGDTASIWCSSNIEDKYEPVKTFPSDISDQELTEIVNEAGDFFLKKYRDILNKYLKNVPEKPVLYDVEESLHPDRNHSSDEIYKFDISIEDETEKRVSELRSKPFLSLEELVELMVQDFWKLIDEDEYDDALALSEKLTAFVREEVGEGTYGEACVLNLQSLVYFLKGQYQDALFIDQDIYEMPVVKAEGLENFRCLNLRNIIDALTAMDAYEEALKYAMEYLQLCSDLYGYDDETTVEAVELCIPVLLHNGEKQVAFRYAVTAYTKYKEIYGPKGEKTLEMLSKLANFYLDIGNIGKAIELDLLVFKENVAEYGESDERTLDSLLPVLYDLCQTEGYRDVDALGRYYVQQIRKICGKDSLRYIKAVYDYGNLLLILDKWGRALSKFESCLEMIQEKYPEKVSLRFMVMRKMSSCRKKMKHVDIAYDISMDIYEEMSKLYGENDIRTLEALERAVLLIKEKDYKRTLEQLEYIYHEKKYLLGETNQKTLYTLCNISNSFSALGDYQKSLELNLKLFQTFSKKYGRFDEDTLLAENNLIRAFRNVGNPHVALGMAVKAYEGRKAHFGENHPETQTAALLMERLTRQCMENAE